MVSFYGKYPMIDGKWLQNEKEVWDGREKKLPQQKKKWHSASKEAWHMG